MTDQEKAPFNMAINTLERIGEILRDLHKTEADLMLSPAQKQFIMISHVKQLFSQASPLLSVEGIDNKQRIDDIGERITKLEVPSKITNMTKGGVVFRQENCLLFDPKLEKELFSLQIDIQRELQKLKYFMPPRKNLGTAVGSFE